jgi:hypothetical protein
LVAALPKKPHPLLAHIGVALTVVTTSCFFAAMDLVVGDTIAADALVTGTYSAFLPRHLPEPGGGLPAPARRRRSFALVLEWSDVQHSRH